MRKPSSNGTGRSKEVGDPSSVREALRKAERFAHTGHHFPFVCYTCHDTVFWPGCGLAGAYPDIVKKTVEILTCRLGAQVGVALDCCYDPVFQLGDEEPAMVAARRIQDRLASHNTTRVITGCVNCQKVLSRFLTGTTVEHVLEALPPDAFETPGEKQIYLHHPCQVFQFDSTRERAREMLRGENTKIVESPAPMCCGYGGGMFRLYPTAAGELTRKITEAAKEYHIVTYCTGCQDRLAREGRRSTHILEMLSGLEPRRKTASKTRRWVNRLFLSLSQRV
ncbi:MAG TPA: (Fe-S)-binding protein [Syntrophales bacterium]|nr:(Fe-S)-binding protein [Syntrophales bacterium]